MKKSTLITGMMLALTCASSLAATTDYWNLNSSGTWNTTTNNWSSDLAGTAPVVFTTGDAVIFSSTLVTAALTSTMAANFAVASLTKNGSQDITLAGLTSTRTLTLNDNTVTVNAGRLIISTNVTLATTGDFVKAGAGLLSLGFNAPTIGGTGNFSITGGEVDYSINRLPTTSVVTMAAGTTLGLAGAAGNVFTQAGLAGGGGTVKGTTTGAYALKLTRASGASDFAGVIQNGTATALGFTKDGAFTQTFSGAAANTYTGTTTVNTGSLFLNKTAGVNAIAGNITIGDGSSVIASDDILQLSASNQISDASVVSLATGVSASKALLVLNGNSETVGGLATLSGDGSNSFVRNGSSSADSTLTVNDASSRTFSGVMEDGGSNKLNIVKSGNGTWTLGGANTFTGLTTVSAGILQVNVDQALGTTAAGTTVSAGAALKLNAVNYSTAEALTINSNGISGGGALVNSGTSTFAGQITAATNSTINTGGGTLNLTGGLVKNGTVLTLTGGGIVNVSGAGISGSSPNSDLVVDATIANLNVANTYNGPTYIRNGGVINANVAGALPISIARSAIIMDDSGTGSSNLTLGASQAVASLTGISSSSTVTLGSNTLTIGTTGGSTTFAGVISGALGNVTKDGTSTQVFAGNNNYTGTTTVSAGTLLINGDQSTATGNMSVSSAATLGGSGKIGGAVTVQNGGFLAPGNNTTGILTVASLALNSTSTTQFEINGAGAPGVNYDQIVVNSGGALALNGAFTIAFGTSLADSTSINLFSYGSIIHTGDFTSLVSTGFYGGAGHTWTQAGDTFTYNTGPQLLTFNEATGNLTVVVPEPSTWALLAGAGTFLMVMRCRRLN